MRKVYLSLAARIEIEEPSDDLKRVIAWSLQYNETRDGWRDESGAPLRWLPDWLKSLDESTRLIPPGWMVGRTAIKTDTTRCVVELCPRGGAVVMVTATAPTEARARAAAAFRARAFDASKTNKDVKIDPSDVITAHLWRDRPNTRSGGLKAARPRHHFGIRG